MLYLTLVHDSVTMVLENVRNVQQDVAFFDQLGD